MTMPNITAAICTYNRYDTLPKAIVSLTHQTLPVDQLEIIVVDNSPDHGRSHEISEDFDEIPNLTWVIEKTPGLSNARNVATAAATAPIIAFMDDDAIASPSWLERLAGAFAQFGEHAHMAGGRVEPIWDAPQPDWLADDLLGFVSVVDWGGVARFAGKDEWVAGTNVAFRVDALKDAGGFSTNLGRIGSGHSLLSNDENDVIARIGAKGGRLVYVPDAAVEHLVPAERLAQGWFRRRVAWQATSDYLLDPVHQFNKAAEYWNGVTDYYARLPPKYRNPRGLYVHQSDPEMFRMQISALYNFTIALLSGFHGIEAVL
jgi:glycosyltransferase involved in cell wall biosynthesis